VGYDLKAGDTCTVQRQLMFDGKLAFNKGEQVRVEAVNPDPQRPGFKYVVFSRLLQQPIRLRGIDIERNSCFKCGAALDPHGFKCPKCGWVIPGQEVQANRESWDKFFDKQQERNIRRYNNWGGIFGGGRRW